MILGLYRWLRRRVVRLAIRNPALTTAIVFFLLFTVHNHVEFATGMAIQISPFWQMLLMGALMSVFGSLLLFEVIRLHRRLAEVHMVRTVASSLHHEINNPLMVIQFCAERMESLQRYDQTSVHDILVHGHRIRDVVLKLSDLDQEVRLHRDPGFPGLIDLPRSR